jgi:hypothetical protein
VTSFLNVIKEKFKDGFNKGKVGVAKLKTA